jgi:hypothetical protein
MQMAAVAAYFQLLHETLRGETGEKNEGELEITGNRSGFKLD